MAKVYESLEPQAIQALHASPNLNPEGMTPEQLSALTLFSVAVSLKRIADELAGSEKTVGIIGAIFESRNF